MNTKKRILFLHLFTNVLRVNFIFKHQSMFYIIMATLPKAFFAILGKLLPDQGEPFDQNSDPFWKENTNDFFKNWVLEILGFFLYVNLKSDWYTSVGHVDKSEWFRLCTRINQNSVSPTSTITLAA